MLLLVGVAVILALKRQWIGLSFYVAFVGFAVVIYLRPHEDEVAADQESYERWRGWLQAALKLAMRLGAAGGVFLLFYGPRIPSLGLPAFSYSAPHGFQDATVGVLASVGNWLASFVIGILRFPALLVLALAPTIIVFVAVLGPRFWWSERARRKQGGAPRSSSARVERGDHVWFYAATLLAMAASLGWSGFVFWSQVTGQLPGLAVAVKSWIDRHEFAFGLPVMLAIICSLFTAAGRMDAADNRESFWFQLFHDDGPRIILNGVFYISTSVALFGVIIIAFALLGARPL